MQIEVLVMNTSSINESEAEKRTLEFKKKLSVFEESASFVILLHNLLIWNKDPRASGSDNSQTQSLYPITRSHSSEHPNR